MKIAMTGYSGPLATRLRSFFEREGMEYKCFSRTTGYDLSNVADLDRAIDDSSDCDVFLNSAQIAFVQTDLLFQWFEHYKDTSKTIISIGSRTSIYSNSSRRPFSYGVQKTALRTASEQLFLTPSRCRVLCLDIGYFDFSDRQMPGQNPMSFEDFSKMLLWLFQLPDSVYVNHISASGPFAPESDNG